MAKKADIGQIRKYFKFSLSNKILQVHVYVLWYISKDFFKWILINSKLD